MFLSDMGLSEATMMVRYLVRIDIGALPAGTTATGDVLPRERRRGVLTFLRGSLLGSATDIVLIAPMRSRKTSTRR
jgi:hypothetical protein